MYTPGPPQSLLTQPVITRAPAVPSLPLTCVPLTTTPLFPACAPGHFGADCRLQCQCRNGGTCDRFSGCVCPSGWHGMHCEKSGTRVFEIPQNKSAFTRHISPWLQVLCSGSSGFRGCSHRPAHITHAGLGSSPEWVGAQRRPLASLRGSGRASGKVARSEVGYIKDEHEMAGERAWAKAQGLRTQRRVSGEWSKGRLGEWSEESNLRDLEQQASRCAGGRRELLKMQKAVRFVFERGCMQLDGELEAGDPEGL